MKILLPSRLLQPLNNTQKSSIIVCTVIEARKVVAKKNNRFYDYFFPILPFSFAFRFFTVRPAAFSSLAPSIQQYFTLPHSFRAEPSRTERFRVFPSVSECFRPYFN